MNVSPDNITRLGPPDVFVFGSNLAGIHGAGAAKQALKWGAVLGVGEGWRGQTYALPTKDAHIRTRPLEDVARSVSTFLTVARASPGHRFLATAVGCGLAGYTPEQIAPLFFTNGPVPDNVWLPDSFWGHAP